jgi:hypothetical protein
MWFSIFLECAFVRRVKRAHMHADRQVAPLDVGPTDMRLVRVAGDGLLARADALGEAITAFECARSVTADDGLRERSSIVSRRISN